MKSMLVLMMLVFSLGIVAAHDVEYKERFSKTYYFGDDLKVISKTTWVEYENEKRFSTRDYRHGYSYRNTGDYFDRKYSDVLYRERAHGFDSYKEKYSRNYHDRNYDSGLRYRYEYVPYLKSYDERKCYVSPPRNKLFYIKC